jgi:hypothetical protein
MLAQREENKGVELTGGGANVQELRKAEAEGVVRVGLTVLVTLRRSEELPTLCKNQAAKGRAPEATEGIKAGPLASGRCNSRCCL